MAEALAPENPAEQVAASSRAMLVVDDDRVCVEASLAACRLLGVTRAELVGREVESLLEPESGRRFVDGWQELLRGGGHAGRFALATAATAIEVTLTAAVLPSRHLLALSRVPSLAAEADDVPPEGRFPRPAERRARPGPTAREREVLQMLAEGRTDAQIADLLGVSPATVQTHVRNAKAKLGARTRAQAVAVAMYRGLIGAES